MSYVYKLQDGTIAHGRVHPDNLPESPQYTDLIEVDTIPLDTKYRDAWDIVNGEMVYKLDELKQYKYQEIRNAFETEAVQPVTVNGVIYHGGYDSGLKLDGAKRNSVLSGLSDVVFYDVDNVGHTLTITQANDVIIAVATKYQQDFAKKQSLMTTIKNALDETTVLNTVW